MQGKIKRENVNQALVQARADAIKKYQNDPSVVFEDLGVIREKRNEEVMAERLRKKAEKVEKKKGGKLERAGRAIRILNGTINRT